MSEYLTATEVKNRWNEFNAKIKKLCETPEGMLGVLIGAQEMIDHQWAFDKARYVKMHNTEQKDEK